MRFILRFEINGIGVYHSKVTSILNYNRDRHPLPDEDGGLCDWYDETPDYERDTYFYGFSSLSQARAWFYSKRDIKILSKNDARLQVYAVPDDAVVVGFTQAVFKITSARFVAEFEPQHLHCELFDEVLETLYNVALEVDYLGGDD